MDGAMRARPKRKANVDGYQGDLALGAYGQTVAYLSGATGNTDLISGDAGQHVLLVLSTRYPPLAEPLRKHIATKGSDAMAVGATTARVALATVERNGFRSKVEPLELTMMIPGLHRLTREGVEEHIGVEFDKLVRPLTVG